ncbi:MAG: hypothetical protein KDA93_23410 [Planctomycetaceae bacterium]|nr:hypothetical protein [Planctomycetaceae bacterium]
MKKTSAKQRSPARHEDPSAEEIRARCGEIRKEWSETTRRQRSGKVDQPWAVPVVYTTGPHMPVSLN